jgi:hypothetical protein
MRVLMVNALIDESLFVLRGGFHVRVGGLVIMEG